MSEKPRASLPDTPFAIGVIIVAPLALAFVVYWDFLTVWFWTDDFIWLEAAAHPDLSEALHEATAFPRGTTPYWRPLIDLHFFSMYRVFGLEATTYHVVNLLIHALTAAMIGLLTLRLTRSVLAGALAGILFAISPTYATMVTWASGATALYAGLFSMLTVLLYLDWLQQGRAGWRLLFPTLTFGAALLAKEESVAVLAVLAFAAISLRPVRRARDVVTLSFALLPFFGVSLAYVLPQLVLVVGSSDAPEYSFGWHVFPRLMESLAWLSLPWPLSDGDWVSPARWAAFATFTALAVSSALRRRILLPLLYLATAVMLVPSAFFTSEFLSRWTYLASIPWAMFVAVLLAHAAGGLLAISRPFGYVVGVVVVALFVVLLSARTIDTHVWVPALAKEYQAIERSIAEGCGNISGGDVVFLRDLQIAGPVGAVPALVRLRFGPFLAYETSLGDEVHPSLTQRGACTLYQEQGGGYIAVPHYERGG